MNLKTGQLNYPKWRIKKKELKTTTTKKKQNTM